MKALIVRLMSERFNMFMIFNMLNTQHSIII